MKMIQGIKVYGNLQEVLDPSHTCLVVWDVQKGLFSRIFNPEELAKNLKGLVTKLRSKVPIVYTLITPPDKQVRSSWTYYSMMKRFGVDDPNKLPDFMGKGNPDREVIPDVQPQEKDIVIEKPTASIFIGTYFEFMMKNRGIETIIFTGIATEIGVESSARDAANRGFYPVIAADCVSSMDKEAHERSLENMKKMFICEKSEKIIEAVLHPAAVSG